MSDSLQHWRCPICRRPVELQNNPDFPFCSERCRTVDLGYWASEAYRISEALTETPPPQPPVSGSPASPQRKRRGR